MWCRQSRQGHARLKEAQNKLQALHAEHAELSGQHDELLARSSSLQQHLTAAKHSLKEVMCLHLFGTGPYCPQNRSSMQTMHHDCADNLYCMYSAKLVAPCYGP